MRSLVLMTTVITLAIPMGLSAAPQAVPVLHDIWLWDETADEPTRVTDTSDPGRRSMAARISADGRRVVFHSDADFLDEGIPTGTDEIWLYDVHADELSRVTHASDSQRESRNPSASADGSLVVFESDSDFLGDDVPPTSTEIWLYRAATAELTRLTRAPAAGASRSPVISSDGSTVAFHSTANFDGMGESGATDVWLLDVESLDPTRITRSVGGHSGDPDLDGRGERVVFLSDGDPLGQGGASADRTNVYLYDARTGTTTPVTGNTQPSRESEAPDISRDGTRVVFHSDADLLGEGRPDSVDEIWLYEVADGSLRRLTETWIQERDEGQDPVLHPDAQRPRITADGRRVVFASDADFLEEGLPNGFPSTWILDVEEGDLERIDTRAGSGSGPAIDDHAERVVLFRTGFDDIRNARVGAGALTTSTPPRPGRLTGEEASRDLDAFRAELESRWAYLRANGVDYETPILDLHARTAEGMDTDAFGIELQKIVSLFIDGHARVGGFRYPDGFLRVIVEYTDGRYLALRPDRSEFLDPEFPFITDLDGRPLEEWISAAETFVSDASPQWTRRNALEMVSRIRFMRDAMGLESTDSVRVGLRSVEGDIGPTTILPVAPSPSGGTWSPETTSGFLEGGDIGYLRLTVMSSGAVEEVLTWMPRFRETRGLIVDVRGNLGGSRDALRALFPYLMSESDPPRVVNTARYRLHPDFERDHLGGSRFMYRESWTGWTAPERLAIAEFKGGFEPQWSPPDEEFSEWHYLVMSRRTNPDAYHYDRPVIVLLDQNSFSATDIFVSSFKGWRDVTLVGTPSGGGSARQVATRLPVSGIFVNLASMASFQRTGRLHDGNGTEPDVLIHPAPESFLRGGPDNVLETAIELLR